MENGFVSKLLAIKQAAQIGCSGAHQNSHGEWIPCSSIKQYLAITQPTSVKSRMSLEDMRERSKRRKKKGRKRRDGWEKLRERRLLGIGALQDGSVVSANGPQGRVVTAFGGGTIPNMMNGNPNPPNVPGGFASKSLGETIGSPQTGSTSIQRRDGDGDGYVSSTPGGPDDTRVSPKNTNSSQRNQKKPPKGLVVKGNINLNNRPIVKNKDGSISTVRSISMTEGKLTVLIPTVIRNSDGTGKIVSNQEAWRHYRRTGEHLGKFSNPKDADAYAVSLSKEQAAQYLPKVKSLETEDIFEEKSEDYSPRDNDDDVFIDIESARRRSRQLGCIGVSRRMSKSGKIVWMPCTNLTDYNNLTGMTALGRHNQDKRTQKIVRTILSNELKKRKKSLVEEIIGKAIGPKISGVSRFAARTISQSFDPRAEDGDGDGLLQDGSAFERPALPGRVNTSIDNDVDGFASSTRKNVERDKKIIDAYNDTNLTIAEIAKQNNVSLDVAAGILRAARKRGEITDKRVSGIVPKNPEQQRSSVERDKKIIDAYNDTNLTIAEIAKQNNVSLDVATNVLKRARQRGEIADKRVGGPKPKKEEISKSSINSINVWFDTTTSEQREKLTGTPIEDFGASTRSTRGFSSASKPIKGEPVKIEGLENPDASETNPFRNLGGRKMGEIIRGLVKPSSKNKKQRTTYLVGGTTGGGKSTVLDEHLVVQGIVPSRNEAAHVDPDFIKLGLTGYNDGAGASMVHDESLRSAQRTMDDARQEGMDLVATGAGSTRQRAIIAQARKNGDRVVAHWVHIPEQEASKRIKEREQLTGRRIPDQTGHFARSIPRMVSDSVANGEVDEFYIWDNNVKQGDPPKLIVSFKNGKLDILDQTKLDEFMNGNKLSPKPREGNVLSDGEREALKESDEFLGLASSSKPKKGGRYTPPTPKQSTGGTPSPFGNSPGTGQQTSFRNDPSALAKTKSAMDAFAIKINDYLTKDSQGNPRNVTAFLTEKLTSRIRATSYSPNAPDGTPISLGKLSLKGKLSTPEDIEKVLEIYVPIKDPNETLEQFSARIIKNLPHMEFARVSSMSPPERYMAMTLKNFGYKDDLQVSLRDILKEELSNNESFRNLVEKFGMPLYFGGPNDLTGASMKDSGTGALHSPGLGLVLVGENLIKEGSYESIGSTIENRKEDTLQQALRHEWFHYLDAITLAENDESRDKRLRDYLSGLTDLLGKPEKRIKKIYPNEKIALQNVEKILLENTAKAIQENNPNMSVQEALSLARQRLSAKLQDVDARNEFINSLLPSVLDEIFSPSLIDALVNDRGGISDAAAKRYSQYARYGIHELIAEIGRMITSTASERSSATSNIVKIDASTIDILRKYMPSIPRSVWVKVIKDAYPGIQIKQLKENL